MGSEGDERRGPTTCGNSQKVRSIVLFCGTICRELTSQYFYACRVKATSAVVVRTDRISQKSDPRFFSTEFLIVN